MHGGRISGPLTLDTAERINLGFNDHETFCRECLPIRDLSGSKVPLILSPGQLKEHAAIEEQ
jgi:hypothetical protein